VVDRRRLLLVSLTDSMSELSVVFEDAGSPERLRWRVRFKSYPAYRNINESYRDALWGLPTFREAKCGNTFTVSETPRHASWATGHLEIVMPSVQHYVVATLDDVVEVLTDIEPEWEQVPAAAPGDPAAGKSTHLWWGEDAEAIERLERQARGQQD